jgi:hypothetical protein
MPQISEKEFERLPLRAHQFLAGVPLHDVWAVDLPSPHAGITLDEFLRVANERLHTPTPIVRGLLDLRLLTGRLFGWGRPRPSTQAAPTFADRLTDADRGAIARASGRLRRAKWAVSRRLSVRERKTRRTDQPDGPRGGVERVVETANSYRFYFAVYVRSVGRLTPFYMAAIDPFRKLIVYPSLLRSVRANWDRTMAALGT